VATTSLTRFPAYATSMGRVLLASLDPDALDAYLTRVTLTSLTKRTVPTAAALRRELSRVREQGYAIVDQELEEGLLAIAAPIHDRSGAVAGAVNVSAHAARVTADAMRQRFLPPLLAATAAIDADLRRTT
jgi:IclR family transcriptional regulator, pca regulon regulatory protein